MLVYNQGIIYLDSILINFKPQSAMGPNFGAKPNRGIKWSQDFFKTSVPCWIEMALTVFFAMDGYNLSWCYEVIFLDPWF